jgi:hypothetical protein
MRDRRRLNSSDHRLLSQDRPAGTTHHRSRLRRQCRPVQAAPGRRLDLSGPARPEALLGVRAGEPVPRVGHDPRQPPEGHQRERDGYQQRGDEETTMRHPTRRSSARLVSSELRSPRPVAQDLFARRKARGRPKESSAPGRPSSSTRVTTPPASPARRARGRRAPCRPHRLALDGRWHPRSDPRALGPDPHELQIRRGRSYARAVSCDGEQVAGAVFATAPVSR